MQPAEIAALIQAELANADARVASADNTHFEAVVISPDFEGKRPIQRHQMIYACLGDRMGGEIHALSIQAFTPDEWQSRRSG